MNQQATSIIIGTSAGQRNHQDSLLYSDITDRSGLELSPSTPYDYAKQQSQGGSGSFIFTSSCFHTRAKQSLKDKDEDEDKQEDHVKGDDYQSIQYKHKYSQLMSYEEKQSNFESLGENEQQEQTLRDNNSKGTYSSRIKDLLMRPDKSNEKEGFEQQVLRLDLSGRALTMISPLSQYTHLTHLNLSNNRIAVIENLERLTLLTHLDLSFNQITILPNAIQANHNLHEFNLSNNRILTIDDIVNLRNLTNLMILDIKDNPVVQVPEYFQFIRTILPQLQVLDEKNVSRNEQNWNRSFESQFSSKVSQQTTNKMQQLGDVDTYQENYHMLENNSIANRPNYVYSFGVKSSEQQEKSDWIENEGIMQALKKQIPTSQDYLIRGVSIGSSPSSQNVVFLNGSIQTDLDSEDNVLDKQFQEQRFFFTGTNRKKAQYSSFNSGINNTSDQSKNCRNQDQQLSKNNKIEAEERQKSKGESQQFKSNSGFIDKETSQKFGLLADTAIEQLRYSQLSISQEDAMRLKQRLFNQKNNELPGKPNQGHFTSEVEEDKVDLTNLQSFSEDQRDKSRDSQIAVSYFNEFQDGQGDSLGVSEFSREDGKFQRSVKDGREIEQHGEDQDDQRKLQEFTLRNQRSPGAALSAGGCQQISNFSQIQSLFDHIESHRGDFCLQEFTQSYTAVPNGAKTSQSLMTTEQAKESRDTFERNNNNQCNETFEKQGLSQNIVSEKYVTSENIQNSEQQSMNTSTLNSNIMDQERQCQSVAGTLHMLIDGFLDLHSTFGEISGRVSEAAEKCLTLTRKINDCVDETERYSISEKERFILEITSFQSDFESSMAQTSLFISELSSTIKTFMNQVGMNPQNEPSPREFLQPQIPSETMAKAKTLIINLHQSNQNLSQLASKVRDGLCSSKQQTQDFLVMKFTTQMHSLIDLFEELSSLSLSCADSFGNIEHTSERLLKYFVHLSRLFQARHVISFSQHRRTTSKDQAKSMILSFREQLNQTSDINSQNQLLERQQQEGRSFSLESFRLKFQDLEKASIQRCELLQKSKNKIERDFSELSKSHSELQSNYESLQRKHKLLQDKYSQELERKLDQKNAAAFQELEQNIATTQLRVKELEKELENSESQKQLWMIDTRILKEQVELVNKDFSNLEKSQSFQAEQYSKLVDQHRLVQEENNRLNSHLLQTQTLLKEFQAKEQLQVQQHQQLQLQQQQNNQLMELQSQDFEVKQLIALLSSLSQKIQQTPEIEEGQLANQNQNQQVLLTEDFLNKLKIVVDSHSHKEITNSQTQTDIFERQSPQITNETAEIKGTSVSKTPSRLRSQRLLLLLEEEQSVKSQSLGESSLQILSSANNHHHSKLKNDSTVQGIGGIQHIHQQQNYAPAFTHSPNKIIHQNASSSSSEQLYKLAAKKAAEKKHESTSSFNKVLKPKWLSSSPEGKVEPGYNFLPISSDRILKNHVYKDKMQLQQSSFEEGNSSGNLTYHPLTCRQESSGGFIQNTKKKNQKDQRFHEQMTALSCKSALQQSFHNKSSELKNIEKRSGNQRQKNGTPERIVVHNLQENHNKLSQEVKPWNFLKKESKHTAGSLKILFQQQQFSKHSCPSNKSLHMNSSMQSVSGIQNQSMQLPQTNNLPSSTLSALNSTGSSNNGLIMNHCTNLSTTSVIQKDNSKKFKNCMKSVANAQKNIQIFRKMQENLKNEEIIAQSVIKPAAVVSTLDGTTSFKKIFRSQSNLQQRGNQFPASANTHNPNNNNTSSTCNQSTNTHQHTNTSSTQHNSSNNAQHNSSSNSNISINLFSQLMNINCSQNVSARSKQVNFKSPNTLEPSLSSGFLVPQTKVANPPAKKQKRKNLVAKKTRGCEQSSITEASCPVIPSEQPQKSPLNCTFSGQFSAPNHAKSASSVISSSFQPFNMDASPLLVQDILAQNQSSSTCPKKTMTLKSQLQIDEIPHSSSQYHHFQNLLKSTLKSNKNQPNHSVYPNLPQQNQVQL